MAERHRPSVVIVVAVAQGGVIGRDGDLPWRLPSDLKRFKAVTIGKPVIMGRKTYESIGRPLPGRPNIVISRTSGLAIEGVTVTDSLEAAVDSAKGAAKAIGADEICVIGGGEIYRQAISLAEILHVTEVDAQVEGDTRFPVIDPSVFERVFEEPIPQGEKDSHPMRFVTYRRKPAQDAANGTILPHLP